MLEIALIVEGHWEWSAEGEPDEHHQQPNDIGDAEGETRGLWTWRDLRKVGYPVDTYGFGIVTWELLSGQRPFSRLFNSARLWKKKISES